MACDAFCANHGCNQGPGCAARDDRHTDRKPMNRTANAIEYTLLKAHQLTADEIGAATGYPANVVKRGLAELAAGQLAHKAKDDQREVWRWGRAPNGAMTPTPAVAARGTYQSEPHPATLARPGGQDAYRLPSRYGDRLEPLKGHKAAATISRERS